MHGYGGTEVATLHFLVNFRAYWTAGFRKSVNRKKGRIFVAWICLKFVVCSAKGSVGKYPMWSNPTSQTTHIGKNIKGLNPPKHVWISFVPKKPLVR